MADEIYYEVTDEVDPNGMYSEISLIQEAGTSGYVTTSDYMYNMQEEILDDVPVLHYKRNDYNTTDTFAYDRARFQNDDVQVIDKDWVQSRFMTPGNQLADLDRKNRFFSSSSWKITSTQLGSSIAINARPQFTRYADIKGNNRGDITLGQSLWNPVRKTKCSNLGMGRYYSEAIDDNVEQIFMQFGVPEFNSLLSFFTRAVDYVDQYVANHASLPVGYTLGNIVGTVVRWLAFPAVSLICWVGSLVFKVVFGTGQLSYYYMKPAMHSYWSSVNLILNQMAVELGLLGKTMQKNTETAKRIGIQLEVEQETIEDLSILLDNGNIYDKNTHYIDIFRIAAKPQTLALRQFKAEYNLNKAMGGKQAVDMIGHIASPESVKERNATTGTIFQELNRWASFEAFLDKVMDAASWVKGAPDGLAEKKAKADAEKVQSGNSIEASKANGLIKENKDKDGNVTSTTPAPFTKDGDDGIPFGENQDPGEETSYGRAMAQALDAYMRDGMAYAIFNVDFTGSMSDSISTSVSEIQTGTGAKGMSKDARHMKFNLAGGNLAGGFIQDITSTVLSILQGALDGVTMGFSNVLQTILGGGYVNMPKTWDDSDIELATTSYSIDLVSPYGNVLSQLQNIYIPLAMIMAGALPLKAGENSYTSPYLCSIFNKGKQNINLGMITSVTIERGTGNLGFTKNKRPLGFRVTFTVTDLNPTVTAPISQTIFQNNFNIANYEDDNFGRYIGVLCSRDFYSNTYLLPKFQRKMARNMMAVSQAMNPNSHAMMLGSIFYPFFSPIVAAKYVDPAQSNYSTNKGD